MKRFSKPEEDFLRQFAGCMPCPSCGGFGRKFGRTTATVFYEPCEICLDQGIIPLQSSVYSSCGDCVGV